MSSPTEPHSAPLDWARSGAMALTGAPDGPPLFAPGAPATAFRRALETMPLPQGIEVELLGERAAIAGLSRSAPWSAGGAFRTLPAGDGHWFGLSLARAADLDLVPALIEGDAPEPWAAIAAWVRHRDAGSAAQRARLLGLAACVVGEAAGAPPGVAISGGSGTRNRGRVPLVVDLTSLWAGPLCAHLLGLCGARVIKVESRTRPDGARRGPAAFYDLLHAGHESVAVDFTRGSTGLATLLAAADVVLEASRPRALEQLGHRAADYVDTGTIWASITAYGRNDPLRIGFGDDVAAAAGLTVEVDGVPVPVGDAIADPLAGAAAASAVWQALQDERGALVDVSMAGVAATAARLPAAPATIARTGDGWLVETRDHSAAVAQPTARTAPQAAAAFGADTDRVLIEVARM